jgi:hypothetical protein
MAAEKTQEETEARRGRRVTELRAHSTGLRRPPSFSNHEFRKTQRLCPAYAPRLHLPGPSAEAAGDGGLNCATKPRTGPVNGR